MNKILSVHYTVYFHLLHLGHGMAPPLSHSLETCTPSPATGTRVFFNLKLRSKWHQHVSMHLSAHHYHQPATTTTTMPQWTMEIGQEEGNGWCFHPFPRPG